VAPYFSCHSAGCDDRLRVVDIDSAFGLCYKCLLKINWVLLNVQTQHNSKLRLCCTYLVYNVHSPASVRTVPVYYHGFVRDLRLTRYQQRRLWCGSCSASISLEPRKSNNKAASFITFRNSVNLCGAGTTFRGLANISVLHLMSKYVDCSGVSLHSKIILNGAD
jgi:hypothetical protein